VVAGAADQIVETGAFAAEYEDAVSAKVELVIVRSAAFIQADDPDVLLFQLLKSADQVDDASNAKVFGGTGAGFYGDRAERRSTALREDYAVDAGAIGNAQKSAEILRIFDAI
jgi:hypothetical protein